ncbi:MAG TPA: aminopeptidase P N-terminal domain-containing protein, partial [Candidatus Saccharimonadales bacterium]
MSSLFSSDFFVHNRRRLQEVLPVDVPIVITANGLLQRGADSPYAFTQDANFWYLTGVEEPDVTLVIDGQREFLIAPIREGARATFDGSIDQKKLIKISGVPE